MSQLPRIGWSGVGLGLLAILTCELPLIIAFFGFAGILAIDLPVWLEPVGIAIATLGTGILLYWRFWLRSANGLQAEEMK